MSKDEEILSALDRRFSQSGECRSLPIELAKPAPDETKPDGIIMRNTFDDLNDLRKVGLARKSRVRRRRLTAEQREWHIPCWNEVQEEIAANREHDGRSYC